MGLDYKMIDGKQEEKFCQTFYQSDCTDVGGIMDDLEVVHYSFLKHSISSYFKNIIILE